MNEWGRIREKLFATYSVNISITEFNIDYRKENVLRIIIVCTRNVETENRFVPVV